MSTSIYRRHNIVYTSKKGGSQGSKENSKLYTKRVIYGSNPECFDSQFPDNQSSQTKSSFPNRKSACIDNSLRYPVSTPTIHPDLLYIIHISKITTPYIENIMNVKEDGNYGYRVIVRHMGMDEEIHVLVHSALIHELKTNKCDYLPIFSLEECFEYIMNSLNPPTISGVISYIDKWMTLSDMGHIIATYFNRVVVQLICPERGICETFFPI